MVVTWETLDDGGFYITNYNVADMLAGTPQVAGVLASVYPTAYQNGGDRITYLHNATFSGLTVGNSSATR